MKYKSKSTNNIEPVYYIKAFLEDDDKKVVSCFLGTDSSNNSFSVNAVGKLRLHIFNDGSGYVKKAQDEKLRFFLNAVFFKDKELAEELLEHYVLKSSLCLNQSPPIVEEMARYKDIPLQIIERIGLSNGFIKETVYFGKRPVGYRLTIK